MMRRAPGASARSGRAHSSRAPAPPASEVARARQRAAPQEPEQVAHAARAVVAGEDVDVDVIRRLGVGVRRRLGGLDAHVVAEAAQRLQLVDDERLRQLRPLVKDEQQPHDRPTVEPAARSASPASAPAALETAVGGDFNVSAIGRWR